MVQEDNGDAANTAQLAVSKVPASERYGYHRALILIVPY